MKQTMSVPYPVSRTKLLRALTDRAFHEARIRALGSLSSEVLGASIEGDEFVIRIRRSMRNTAPVPDLLRKRVPAVFTLEHEGRWKSKTGEGHVTLRVDGLPVQLSCQITAIARGGSTELSHDWDVRCSLPMVGGAVERFLASDLPQRMEEEARAGRPLLAQDA